VLKHIVNVPDKKIAKWLNRFLLSFFLSSDEVAQYFMNFSWRFSHEFYREQSTTLSLFHNFKVISQSALSTSQTV